MRSHTPVARKTVNEVHGNGKDDRLRFERASKVNMIRGKNMGQVLPEIVVFTYTTKRRWLRHRATSLAVSIPDGVIGVFHLHNSSAALWSWGRLSL